MNVRGSYPSSIPYGPQLGPSWAPVGPSWAKLGSTGAQLGMLLQALGKGEGREYVKGS